MQEMTFKVVVEMSGEKEALDCVGKDATFHHSVYEEKRKQSLRDRGNMTTQRE